MHSVINAPSTKPLAIKSLAIYDLLKQHISQYSREYPYITMANAAEVQVKSILLD